MPSQTQPAACDLAVVGAGPAGLLAALAAASQGLRVVLLERMDRPALKLLASGGGRCNLASTLSPDAFMARLGRQGRFLAPALADFGQPQLTEFFAALGVTTFSPDGLRIYPASESADDVQQALLNRCAALDVTLLTQTQARALILQTSAAGAPAVTGVETPAGPLAARAVLLACGGRGYPSLGSDGSGYDLARRAGHTIVAPTPALVGLVTRQAWPTRCAGVSLPNARVAIHAKGASKAGLTGDVLFTHKGLSGPAILDISGDVVALLQRQKEVTLAVTPAPHYTPAEWLARFDQWQHDSGTKRLRSVLATLLPASLADELLALADIPGETICAQVPRQPRQRLAALLASMEFTITRSEGFESAMVTRGGVKLREVDPQTLRSKLVAGLYFAGEILDLDGPSGGFNLELAFATGHLAGTSAARSLLNIS